jgi:hypothetical protein
MSLNKEDLVRDRTNSDYYNISDFERITDFLIDLETTITSGVTSWDIGTVLLNTQFQALLDDIGTLRNNCPILSITPQKPTIANFNASKANAIEQIIYDIYLLVENKEKSKRYCGIFYCGTIFKL